MFATYCIDSRYVSAGRAPTLELIENWETLDEAIEQTMMMWPEDGTTPVIVYDKDGCVRATFAPAGPKAFVLVLPETEGIPTLYGNVHYITDTAGKIIATEMTSRNGTSRLTHPS